MAETGMKTPRERYRAGVRTQIKDRAREQIATAGASALSLNAIAKQIGMSGPALYRYFASRDELITELIEDAYQSLADSFRTAAGSGGGAVELAHALRGWALEDPQRYLLVYGTPVPGYHAPESTTAIASGIMATLLEACVALQLDGHSPATSFETHLQGRRRWADGPASPAALRRALIFWTRLHGVLSLELAGHFAAMGFDPAMLYAAELDDLVAP